MKNILSILTILCFFAASIQAQQQASKSKSSDKLYEKGEIPVLNNSAGINTNRAEFSPAFYQNGIVYVSQHKNGPVDKKTGQPFRELFYAEVDENGLPHHSEAFSLRVNSQAHEGPVSFSRDGNLLLFTRNNVQNGVVKTNADGKLVGLKIFSATRGEYDWENISPLPFNSEEYNCAHPTLSADGKKLFFSSDMPGGYGDSDLYYVEKRGDGWSKPINLGSEINTSGREGFPYLHENGVLFFSSNGHGGAGKLDIFMVDISQKIPGEIFNLGEPFNSPGDDLGFIINEDGTKGYFSSDRKGGKGEDDIYLFTAQKSVVKTAAPVLSAMVVAFNAQTRERIPGAEVRIFERSADGFIEGKDLYDIELLPNGKDGNLTMKLLRKSTDDLKVPVKTTNQNGEVLAEMKPGKSYLILVSKHGYESAEIIHSTEGEDVAQTIDAPLRSANCINLNGVVNVENLKTKVPNAQIRIVNETTGAEELLRSNASGEFDFCLPKGCEFAIYAEKEGYTKGMTKISTLESPATEPVKVAVSMQLIVERSLKEPIKEGSVIILENIYYDFNQSVIRKGAARELDALADLMKLYPSMEIELYAHTDARGTEEYNLDLSLQRAEAAKRYLEQRGIATRRIQAFGKGEQEVRNHCTEGVECTDEEHQYNRRTEVKVMRIEEQVKVQYGEGNPLDKEKE